MVVTDESCALHLSHSLACVAGAAIAVIVGCTRARPDAARADEAGVTTISRSLLSAYAANDEDAFAEQIGAAFLFFEDGRVDSREAVIDRLRARKKRSAPPRSLGWGERHVLLSGATATFLGDVVEHLPAEGERSARVLQGWNTIVWAWNGTKWEAAYWQWQQGGLQAQRDLWNAEYRSGGGFASRPNRLLVDVAGSMKPGTALDVGMGQGRNAIFLASQGWTVTGVDISDVGLQIARDTALELKLPLESVNADVSTWDFGTDKWDLVALIYFRPDDRELRKIKDALRLGGRVVVEGFHSPQAQSWEAGQLAAIFKDGFRVERDEVVIDMPDWGTHPDKLIRFVAQRR